MNKAANIYWDDQSAGYTASTRSQPARKRRTAAVKADQRTAPWWVSFVIVTSIFVMLCVSINYRAFTVMRDEVDQNGRLSGQIQNLMDENLALQEEIHTLKSDPNAIVREAKRIGIALKSEKVSVPAN